MSLPASAVPLRLFDSKWVFPTLTVQAFTTALIPAIALYRDWHYLESHFFSLVNLLTIMIALPFYWSRVAEDRAAILASAERDPELAKIALSTAYRGLSVASILTALSLMVFHFK